MKFDEFDIKMRVYEQSLDQIVLPDLYLAVRLDGRTFTKLTKEVCQFEAPFDVRFRDLMVKTVLHLMDCGFRVVYGFTESDEISLLFHPEDRTFGRKVRKINSTLAGEASAAFSLALGRIAVFDCRVIPLPNRERVRDYFVWRQEDAHRNALNAWCYWTLRKEGNSKLKATEYLQGRTTAFKNELLFERGINFNDLPGWQKRGIGVYFREEQKVGYNPIMQEQVEAKRRKLYVEYELKVKEEYGKWVEGFLDD